MVLEFWFEQKCVHPSTPEILLQSFAFVSIAVAGVHMIGLEQAPTAFLFLIGLPSIPFLLKIFQCEVEIEEKKGKFWGSSVLARHYSAFRILAAFFLGMVLSFAFWYLVLPQENSAMLFQTQKQELKNVQGVLLGQAISTVDAFEKIFTHNLQVLLFVIVFSVIYGAGAVFILIWNASVIGVFLGEFSKAYVLNGGTGATGIFGGQVTGVSLGLLGILPHGIFELLSYLAAALAGGILSVSIIRGDYKSQIFPVIIYDIAKLLAWAIVFLAIGAFIETYPLG
ncbi:MAG: stage II sporulation protein M [Candidatus Norongarragalinales archaeon]